MEHEVLGSPWFHHKENGPGGGASNTKGEEHGGEFWGKVILWGGENEGGKNQTGLHVSAGEGGEVRSILPKSKEKGIDCNTLKIGKGVGRGEDQRNEGVE